MRDPVIWLAGTQPAMKASLHITSVLVLPLKILINIALKLYLRFNSYKVRLDSGITSLGLGLTQYGQPTVIPPYCIPKFSHSTFTRQTHKVSFNLAFPWALLWLGIGTKHWKCLLRNKTLVRVRKWLVTLGLAPTHLSSTFPLGQVCPTPQSIQVIW